MATPESSGHDPVGAKAGAPVATWEIHNDRSRPQNLGRHVARTQQESPFGGRALALHQRCAQRGRTDSRTRHDTAPLRDRDLAQGGRRSCREGTRRNETS